VSRVSYVQRELFTRSIRQGIGRSNYRKEHPKYTDPLHSHGALRGAARTEVRAGCSCKRRRCHDFDHAFDGGILRVVFWDQFNTD
jgi:hypothetical protein